MSLLVRIACFVSQTKFASLYLAANNTLVAGLLVYLSAVLCTAAHAVNTSIARGVAYGNVSMAVVVALVLYRGSEGAEFSSGYVL
jgi:putative effector of murein hydrolase